jgi:hypothetical protein
VAFIDEQADAFHAIVDTGVALFIRRRGGGVEADALVLVGAVRKGMDFFARHWLAIPLPTTVGGVPRVDENDEREDHIGLLGG